MCTYKYIVSLSVMDLCQVGNTYNAENAIELLI